MTRLGAPWKADAKKHDARERESQDADDDAPTTPETHDRRDCEVELLFDGKAPA